MTEFTVNGMTCGGCVRGVTGAIQRIDPGATVNVDLASKTVSIESAAAPGVLREAIETAGFEVA